MSVLERVREVSGSVESLDVPCSKASKRELREELKHALVERLGLSEVASLVSAGDASRAASELEVASRALINLGGFEEVLPSEKDMLIQEVIDEIVGLGPLQPLVDDASITEIMVNGTSSLYFERGGHLEQAERVFDTPEQILLAVDRILAPLGRRLDDASPIVNARLKNGDRVNAVITPIAVDGPALTIRKFSGELRTLQSLIELGSVPAWYAQLLSWAVRLRQDIAVAGGTGSGKTTLLNALSCEIPCSERIVTIEDSAELQFSEELHVVRLEAREASIEGIGEVPIRSLVINALRMRPDRIIVGEVRSGEAADMLTAMNTGHDGSLTTLHAGTPHEAVLRLVLMARIGIELPAELIEEQVATALDLIVMSRRMTDGSRVISTTSVVSRTEAGHVGLEELVSFDPATRRWHLEHEPAFIAQAVHEGLLDEKEVQAWRYTCS